MPKNTKQSKSHKRSAKPAVTTQELDSVFFLKLVLYLVLGSMWVKIYHDNTLSLPLPLGLAVGLFFTSHEHFQIDRKIEFAVLLVAMLVGYVAPFGLYIAF